MRKKILNVILGIMFVGSLLGGIAMLGGCSEEVDTSAFENKGSWLTSSPDGKIKAEVVMDYTPAANSYTDCKVTVYEEGIFAGYRYYDEYGVPVLFPFGHGLSYSEFKYKNLNIAADGEKVTVSFELGNTSATDGKEVVQVYVGAKSSCASRPVKGLKAFAKYSIKAGESVKAKLELDKSAFSYWSYQSGKRQTEDGIYEILVGASSADIRLTGKIKIENGELKEI